MVCTATKAICTLRNGIKALNKEMKREIYQICDICKRLYQETTIGTYQDLEIIIKERTKIHSQAKGTFLKRLCICRECTSALENLIEILRQ